MTESTDFICELCWAALATKEPISAFTIAVTTVTDSGTANATPANEVINVVESMVFLFSCESIGLGHNFTLPLKNNNYSECRPTAMLSNFMIKLSFTEMQNKC